MGGPSQGMAGTFEKMSVRRLGRESAQVYASVEKKTTVLTVHSLNVGGGEPPIAEGQSPNL